MNILSLSKPTKTKSDYYDYIFFQLHTELLLLQLVQYFNHSHYLSHAAQKQVNCIMLAKYN